MWDATKPDGECGSGRSNVDNVSSFPRNPAGEGTEQDGEKGDSEEKRVRLEKQKNE